MRVVPESSKFVIADHNGRDPAPGPCPNPRGWYHSVAGIRDTPEGLVATYRLSDSHTALFTPRHDRPLRGRGPRLGGAPLHRPSQRVGTSGVLGGAAAQPAARRPPGGAGGRGPARQRSGLAAVDPLAAAAGARHGQLPVVERRPRAHLERAATGGRGGRRAGLPDRACRRDPAVYAHRVGLLPGARRSAGAVGHRLLPQTLRSARPTAARLGSRLGRSPTRPTTATAKWAWRSWNRAACWP